MEHEHDFAGGVCVTEGCGAFIFYPSDTEFDELGRPIVQIHLP